MQKSILVVGGGTAGWISAARMARAFGAHLEGGAIVTLIESSSIPPIGVGEGTFPTIKATLQALGIDELTFMRESGATFKQGIKFVDWQNAPLNGEHSHYFHPFENPYGANGPALTGYWLLEDSKDRASFADTVTFQKQVADAARAPKRRSDPPFGGPLQYAYHLDAAKFSQFLARHARGLGVNHLLGTVTEVGLAPSGAIEAVHTAEHGTLKADLYIDCTGQRAELIGAAMKNSFTSVDGVLFTDRAVVCQVPYEDENSPIPSYTISTAHEAGWTWDISLKERRGVGYVYSSNHSSEDAAEAVLRGYLGAVHEGATTRTISFASGYRKTQWSHNCVAVGLSAGFFEPLESTGLVLIEIAVGMLAEMYEGDGPMALAASRFNSLMSQRCQRIVDFIKLHYCLSQRQEPFWRDNACQNSVPDSLRQNLEIWKFRPPNRFDFISDVESFSYANYQYILYGMGFHTDLSSSEISYSDKNKARKVFAQIQDFGRQAVRSLQSNREFISSMT